MIFKNTIPIIFFITFFVSNPAIAENNQISSSAWEGQYIGFTVGPAKGKADPTVHAKVNGYFDTTDPDQTDPEASQNIEATNLSASLFWGINRRTGNILYGLEADVSLTDYNEKYKSGDIYYLTAPGSSFNVVTNIESSWAVSLRARLGYIHEKSLFYISAGPSIKRFKYDFTFTDTIPAAPQLINVNDSKWELGWTAGLGYEFKMQRIWFLKVEYLYSSYKDTINTQSTTIGGFPKDGFTHKLDFTESIFRIGVYRKF